MELRDEAERRAELAVKVARLEEKASNSEKQLNRIEQTLLDHAHSEEGMLKDITKALHDFKESIEEKITLAVEPVRKDVEKYKVVLSVLGGVISVVWAVLTFFKGYIDHWFHSGS